MWKKDLLILLGIICLAPVAEVPAWATTYTVGPGQSIQAAIDTAVGGDEIEVAPGTYTAAIDFKGKAVYLHSSDGPETTIIDATGLNASVVTCKSGEQADTILEGFTLTGGNGTAVDSKKVGGGIYNLNSSPTVKQCILTANSVASGGGGMYNNASNPTVTDCAFSNNSSQDSCGGVYNAFNSHPTFTRCTFSGNHVVVHGGGMVNVQNSSPTVTDCVFSKNTAGNLGGGMLNSVSCSPTVIDCTFTENTAGDGGGMYNNDKSNPIVTGCTFGNNTANTNYGGGMFNTVSSNPRITNSIFSGNTAQKYGGGIYNNGSKPQFTNCIFSSNLTTNGGGGIANYNNSTSTIINCTFSNNTAGYGGGLRNWDSTLSVQNCIVWTNSPDPISSDGASTLTVSFSDIQGNWTGKGNIDSDPQFVDSAAGVLRLSSDSPCIDAGNTSVVSTPLDVDGNPRVVDYPFVPDTGTTVPGTMNIVDMGAHEFGCNSTADDNCDGIVNLSDMAILASHWLEDHG